MTDATPDCRFCGAPLTRTFLDLGDTPLANSYVTAADVAAGRDRAYPLHARVCDSCLLVQVDEVVPAEDIFSDYAYFSSYSAGWVAHARRYADAMTERFGLGPDSLVVEVASNDGYLLRHFVERGIPVLGIEPAANVAEVARAAGVPTEVTFFDRDSGRALAARGKRADLMAANNVFAHVPDIRAFAAGFAEVLKPEGVVTFEFPHLLNLINEVQFDTIYHEHYSYLSLVVVERVLGAVGLRVFDVEELPTHGGSLRVFACPVAAGHGEGPGLLAVRAKETAAGLDRPEAYDGFAPRVEAVRRGFLDFLAKARAEGRRVAAYGAAAKGNTFLNFCGVGAGDITLVADRNPAKQGRLLPGSHVPIVSPDELAASKPDDLVILPWNIAAEVAADMAAMKAAGCRFWIAVPEMREV
ncbi:class I SAM-dependent methyltransferase [Zavarzinia compransoris]|uniref:class I SAM-dependent methyltransferase n=1 Tax=Zavarzinia marina TaxID=2911065 RepID=UPI001F1735C6|nr:class I SAM-dependent methyltransferase [Zavarzinia marina]MCF4167502.1 class I SAM-dependent methyltransferase [Zavarzinia marina]